MSGVVSAGALLLPDTPREAGRVGRELSVAMADIVESDESTLYGFCDIFCQWSRLPK